MWKWLPLEIYGVDMTKYGFKIHPESFYDGSNIIFSDATTINYIKDINIPHTWVGEYYPETNTVFGYKIDKSPNSTLLVVPIFIGDTTKGCFWKDSHHRDYFTLDLFDSIEKIEVNGNKVTVHTIQEGCHFVEYNSKDKIVAKLRVYEVFQTEQLVNRYGLKIKNSIDFTHVSDYSKVGLIVYKNRHKVSTTLNLADHIPNKSSYLVYADWNHPSAVVEFDYTTHTLIVTGGEIDIDIIIVNSNINIQPPNRYGMIIRSSITGQITYSSRYAAVPINTLVPLNKQATQLPFSKNYVSLGRYGLHAMNKYKGTCDVYHSGLIKFNSFIDTGPGTYIVHATRGYLVRDTILKPQINLLVIDGSVFC